MDEGVKKIYSNSMIKHVFLSQGYFPGLIISTIEMLMKFLAQSFIYISENSVIYYTDFLTGRRMLFHFHYWIL